MTHKTTMEQQAQEARELISKTLKNAGFDICTISFLVLYIKQGGNSLMYFEDMYFDDILTEEAALQLEIDTLKHRLKKLQEKGN